MHEEQKEVMEGIWDDPEAREALQQYVRVLLDVAERFVDENIPVVMTDEGKALVKHPEPCEDIDCKRLISLIDSQLP